MDDSLLPRIDMARTTMRPAEAQVAAVILANTRCFNEPTC